MDIATESGQAVVTATGDGWTLTWDGETVPLDAPVGDPEAARAQALTELGRRGVGAGRQLTSAGCAELAGYSNPKSWWTTSVVRPEPDGRYDRRTPWWWESTVRAYLEDRPRRGRRETPPRGRSMQ